MLTFLGFQSIGAQQLSEHVTNPYLSEANRITTVDEFNIIRNRVFREFFGINNPDPIEELSENADCYRIQYKGKEGLISFRYSKGNGTPKHSIEDITENYLMTLLGGYVYEDFVKGYVKQENVHGGFFFNMESFDTEIFMYSKPREDFVWTTIEINLNAADREALARDFISKTKFR
ncbi:hypothetical protein HMPREF0765_1479 [Sphingobacterium spiritivorum ATCC 33300]|uniref:Uncharacterized protein n=2 Tax=Sphingobacterium spiritivorum TaxID=258 RepID=C2FVX3_SPHSI|nr:hypothetical protein HMPREF0765_1479 [Sphingobacterium spiritivorum ATCC 33300]